MTNTTFSAWLNDTKQSHGTLANDLIATLEKTASACKKISASLSRGALAGVLGQAGSENIQGEAQKKLDVIANDILIAEHQVGNHLAGIASEEMDNPLVVNQGNGRLLLIFDPLDGSSNIDINAPVGTIFSILERPQNCDAATHQCYMQPGNKQLAAGYALYGAATQLVLTLGFGVFSFTLDPQQNDFILTEKNLRIPIDTTEFAINMSNQRHWEPAVQRYINELLAGKEGIRGLDFNMRWVAAMVADVHRILCRGGVFLYPIDRKTQSKGGKLRLLYEANPMGWLVEQAGGLISTGKDNILTLEPTGLHQRVPVILGAKNEVLRLMQYHQE